MSRSAIAGSRARLKICWSRQSKNQASEAMVKTNQWPRLRRRHQGWAGLSGVMKKKGGLLFRSIVLLLLLLLLLVLLLFLLRKHSTHENEKENEERERFFEATSSRPMFRRPARLHALRSSRKRAGLRPGAAHRFVDLATHSRTAPAPGSKLHRRAGGGGRVDGVDQGDCFPAFLAVERVGAVAADRVHEVLQLT